MKLKLLLRKKNNTLVEFTYDYQKNKYIARCSTFFTINDIQAKLITYKRYEDFSDSLVADVRIQDEESKNIVKKSYLTGSKDESCLGYLREKTVEFSITSGAIYGWCDLTYICKPTQINLSLQSSCNLTNEVMEEIVANTAQRLHGIIGTDNYEKYVRENILTE